MSCLKLIEAKGLQEQTYSRVKCISDWDIIRSADF